MTGTVRGYDGNGLYMTGKYLTMKTSSTIADDADNNFYVLRLGDVILMQAEALWELGRHAEAVDKLNEIVDRANATLEDPAQRIMRYSLTPGDGSGRYPGDFRVIPTDDAWSARKMILDERRRELAFEGQRWFDLVRCNRYRDEGAQVNHAVEIMNAAFARMYNNYLNGLTTKNMIKKTEIMIREDQLLFAIPPTEINLNPQLQL